MTKGERVFSAVFGLFLLGVGVYALLFSDVPILGRIAAGLALALFGGNMIYAAYQSKRSWLSRIGPLP